MKKIVIIVLSIILIIIILGVMQNFFVNKDNTFDNVNEVSSNDVIIPDDWENIKECSYKYLKPRFNKNNYNYCEDMEFKDKIYYKVIDNYDEYLIYKDNWKKLLDMNEENFKENFLVLVAVENTSMLGVELCDIHKDEDILYIDFNESADNDGFKNDKTCLSIIIPNKLKCNTIEIRDLRNLELLPEYKYGWVNKNTEGLDAVSLDEAVNIAKKYAKELYESKSYMGQYLENYNKLYEIEITKEKPNNYWKIEEGIVEREFVQASFERDVYEITLVREDDDVKLERAIFYVDMYTGEVIGGTQRGD